MKLEGRHTLDAGREVVWSALYDPATLGSILPGCESFEAISAHEFRVMLRLRVGQTVDQFSGTLWLDHVVPFTGFDFQADGEAAAGLIHGRGRVYLEDAAEQQTVLCYEADFEVGGGLAAATGRLLQTTGRAFARRSLEGLQRQLDLRTRTFTTTVAPPAAQSAAATPLIRLDAARRVLAVLGVLLAVALIWRARGRQHSATPITVVLTEALPSDPIGNTAEPS